MQGLSKGGAAPSDMPESAGGAAKSVLMGPKIAYRNLFHDKLSLVVTLVGIVFSVVLVAIQCGLYLGSERTIATVIDRATADIWVIPIGTKSFDDPSLLPGREKHSILAVPGVQNVEELVVGFASWRKPLGGKKAFILVGSNWKNGGLAPWNIIEGSLDELATPSSLAVDKSYLGDLGIDGLGSAAEVNGRRVTVRAVTSGIRSFTTLPFIFTTISEARDLTGATKDQASYQLVRVTPGSDVEQVRAAIAERLPDTEVVTHKQFRDRSLNYWLFKTGAGAALISGAALGIIVGVVIVAQTLYSSTKDHLNEFATLRALGASSDYIIWVILIQALLSAFIGYLIGIALAMAVIASAKGSTLNVVMTPKLAVWLLGLTIGMCVIAAISAIFKVTRIDPSGVFSR